MTHIAKDWDFLVALILCRSLGIFLALCDYKSQTAISLTMTISLLINQNKRLISLCTWSVKVEAEGISFIALAGQSLCSKYLILWHVAMTAKVSMSEVLSTGKVL